RAQAGLAERDGEQHEQTEQRRERAAMPAARSTGSGPRTHSEPPVVWPIYPIHRGPSVGHPSVLLQSPARSYASPPRDAIERIPARFTLMTTEAVVVSETRSAARSIRERTWRPGGGGAGT